MSKENCFAEKQIQYFALPRGKSVTLTNGFISRIALVSEICKQFLIKAGRSISASVRLCGRCFHSEYTFNVLWEENFTKKSPRRCYIQFDMTEINTWLEHNFKLSL